MRIHLMLFHHYLHSYLAGIFGASLPDNQSRGKFVPKATDLCFDTEQSIATLPLRLGNK